jgi:branched-subunit amino acid transport protein
MSWVDSAVLWGIILGGMLVTYATRLSFIAIIPYDRLPSIFRSGLRYVAPSVLAALILPELLKPGGVLNLSIGNHRLLAGVLACLVAWRTKNAWLTISAGMALLWLLSTLL